MTNNLLQRINRASVKSPVKRHREWLCATAAVKWVNLGEAKLLLKWLQGHAWRLQDNALAGGAPIIPYEVGAAGLPETILLKPTQFVKSALSRGQRLMVDSLAGPAGEDAALLTKNHVIEPPLPPLPATNYTGLKSFFYCQQKKKCFPWRRLSALRPPLASACSLSPDEQHAGQSGGRGEDERRRRYTAGEKGKRGRRCEDEECEAATSGGNTEEKHGSQLRHRLFNCPACHSLQGFISSSPTLGANELPYSVLLSAHLLSSILLSIPTPPVFFFFCPLLNH